MIPPFNPRNVGIAVGAGLSSAAVGAGMESYLGELQNRGTLAEASPGRQVVMGAGLLGAGVGTALAFRFGSPAAGAAALVASTVAIGGPAALDVLEVIGPKQPPPTTLRVPAPEVVGGGGSATPPPPPPPPPPNPPAPKLPEPPEPKPPVAEPPTGDAMPSIPEEPTVEPDVPPTAPETDIEVEPEVAPSVDGDLTQRPEGDLAEAIVHIGGVEGRTRLDGMTPDGIVLHATGTGEAGSSSEQTLESLGLEMVEQEESGENFHTTHYAVDRDGTIARYVHPDEKALHTYADEPTPDGQPSINDRSIGITLVNDNTGEQQYTEAQLESLEQLTAGLAHTYGIDPVSITGHNEHTESRSDPAGLDILAFRSSVGETLGGTAEQASEGGEGAGNDGADPKAHRNGNGGNGNGNGKAKGNG